ncbi:MAG: paraquat-inducible protein A [Bacteroidota bacterium]
MQSNRIGWILLWFAAAVFFGLGLWYPIMSSRLFFKFDRPDIYLWSSIQSFYQTDDWFLASLLLVFTFLLPILKWIYLGWSIWRGSSQGRLQWWLEIINKWAMLDVFVVAVILVNLKLSSLVIVTSLEAGVTYFAVSVLCLQGLSFWMARTSDNRNV